MKAKRLAELLMHTPEADVFAFDADMGSMYPITGIVGDETRLEVCTDDPEAGDEETEAVPAWTDGGRTAAYVRRIRERQRG